MFFFPIGCLLLVLFILFLPVFILLLFLNVVTFSFEKLGISPQMAIVLLFVMLIGSVINIPVGRRTVAYSRRSYFGLFQVPVRQEYGLAINLGGAIIPAVLSIYLLFKAPLVPALIATALMLSANFLPGLFPEEAWLSRCLSPRSWLPCSHCSSEVNLHLQWPIYQV